MKRGAGVGQRPGSTVWQWGIKVPTDLRAHYPTQWAHRCSLETADLREANEKASALHSQWLQRFAEQRRELNPQKVDTVTSELAQTLAQRVATALLSADEKLRTDPATAKLLLGTIRAAVPSKLTIGPAPLPAWVDAPTDPLHGLSDELAAELARLNAGMDAEAARHWALQRVSAILPMAQAEARKLGIEFDATTPGALDALRECLKAYRKARRDATLRDLGEIIETPQAPALGAAVFAEGPQYLRDVLPAWTASKTRKPQTVRAATLALEHYEKSTGNPRLAALTRAQGVEFRAYLRGLDVTDKTSRDRLDYVKGMLSLPGSDRAAQGVAFADLQRACPDSRLLVGVAVLADTYTTAALNLAGPLRAGRSWPGIFKVRARRAMVVPLRPGDHLELRSVRPGRAVLLALHRSPPSNQPSSTS